MEKNTKITNIVVIALAVTVVFMSIGFAAFTQQLNINGTATVEPASWEVKFDTTNTAATLAQGSVTPTTNTISDTAYTFAFTLAKPGDFFEADLTVVNAGTINAVLNSIRMSGVDSNNSAYLSYTLSYNGTNYTSDNTSLSIPLNANATAPVKIRVEYLLPAQSSQLPTTQQNVTIAGSLGYSSAD